MDSHGIVASLFGVPRALIGVIHVAALPGAPESRLDVAAIAETAVAEARIYRAAGFHALTIENTHDRPYLKGAVGPEIATAMAVIGAEVRRAVALPLGVQVLAGANTTSLAVAHACGAAFVRVEGFVSPTSPTRELSNRARARCFVTAARSARIVFASLPISRRSTPPTRSRPTSTSSKRPRPRSSFRWTV